MMMLSGPIVQFAQGLSTKPVYSINEAISITGYSRATVNRRLGTLKAFGIAKLNRGRFTINNAVISQPVDVMEKLLPSLEALSRGRRFGKSYNQTDINFAINNIPDKLTTLDYRAWELTRFQHPSDLYIYVKDVEKTATFLKNSGFSEGQRGHIVLLPEIGNLNNEIERVYLDSIAKGGRSMLDAIAIDMLHGDQISVKGRFTTEDVMKVQQDLPVRKLP